MKTRTTTKKPSRKRTGNSFRLALPLVLGVCLSGVFAAGQRSASPQARTIEGTVLDDTGKTAAGAVVQIEDLKSLQVRSYIVQQDGKYHFHGLSSDASYQLHAQLNGLISRFKTVTVFDNGRIVVVNLKLVKKARTLPTSASGKSS